MPYSRTAHMVPKSKTTFALRDHLRHHRLVGDRDIGLARQHAAISVPRLTPRSSRLASFMPLLSLSRLVTLKLVLGSARSRSLPLNSSDR